MVSPRLLVPRSNATRPLVKSTAARNSASRRGLAWTLAVASLLSAVAPSSRLHAADDAYSPDATSGLFSNSFSLGTQTPTAGGASSPASGDRLFFGGVTTGATTLTNNLTGFTFAGLVFNSGAAAFTIGGNDFTLLGDIINNSASAQIINNNIALAATQAVSTNTGNVTLGGIISGTGFGLTKTGTGTLTLSGANTYTGTTTINGGTLSLTGSLASATLALGGGTLAYAPTAAGATQAFTATALNAGGSAVSTTAGNTLNLGATTRAAGATFNVSGAGTVSLSGLANDASEGGGILGQWATVGTGAATTYATLTGGNVVAYAAGTSGTANAIPTTTTNATNYTITTAGTGAYGAASRTVNTLRNTVGASTITFGNAASQINLVTNGILNAGTGLLTIASGGTNAASGLQIGANNGLALDLNAANVGITVSAPISNNTAGASSVTVTGQGANVVTLSGVNTYTGGTNVAGGTLQLGATTGVANTGAAAVFNLSGGRLQYNVATANFNVVNTINLLSDASTLGNVGTAQVNLQGTFNGNGRALNYVAPGSTSRLYLNTTTTGVTQVNIQSGALGLSLGAGDRAGGAPINVASGASLYLAGATNALASNITLNGGTGQAGVGALFQEGAGTPTISGTVTLAATTSIGGNTAGTGNVNISGQVTGAGGLTKIGANTYSLSNANNNYAGATTITAGVLQVGAGGATGSLPLGSAITVGTGAALGFNRTSAVTQGVDFSAAPITGAGGITQAGSGVLTLNAANTYSGDTAINGGTNSTITITNPAGAGTGRLNAAAGATTPVFNLHINGGGTIAMANSFGGNSGVVSTIDVNNNGTGTGGLIQLNGTGLYGNATLNVTGGNGYNLAIAGFTNNAGTAGTATLAPTTASLTLGTYSSSTNSAKVLQLDGTSAGNAVTGVVANGTGTVALIKANTSTWTLSGVNTYSAGTTVNQGLLTVATTGTLGAGNVTVADVTGAALTLLNTASLADSAILTFGNNSAINLNFSGTSDQLAGITDSTTATTLGNGTYTAAQLNAAFGGINVFSGTGSLTIVAVPEPGTWTAVGAGMIGLAAWLRRKRAMV